MTTWIRRLVLVLLIPTALLLSGCLLNVFQTAKTLGEGNVALTLGSGLFDMNLLGTESLYFLTPQARLAVGLAEGIDLGVQTGLLVPFGEGEVVWPGATGDVKFSLLDDPDFLALSLAVGGGFSLETLGLDAYVTLFLDSNVRFVPVFVIYQPHLALAEGFALIQHVAGGLKLRLSDRVRLLVQVDYDSYTYVSYGVAVEVEL